MPSTYCRKPRGYPLREERHFHGFPTFDAHSVVTTNEDHRTYVLQIMTSPMDFGRTGKDSKREHLVEAEGQECQSTKRDRSDSVYTNRKNPGAAMSRDLHTTGLKSGISGPNNPSFPFLGIFPKFLGISAENPAHAEKSMQGQSDEVMCGSRTFLMHTSRRILQCPDRPGVFPDEGLTNPESSNRP